MRNTNIGSKEEWKWHWSDENYKFESLNKHEDMCVQTGGGSDVVVKNNPNMLTYERR